MVSHTFPLLARAYIRRMSTIAERLDLTGASRRDFLTFCGKLMVAAPFGLFITDFLTP